MANIREDKKRNWLSRLKQLKIGKRSDSREGLRYRRGGLLRDDANLRSNGLRRSIMKMHSRVKRAFQKDNNATNREAETVSSGSPVNAVLQNRVTLNSPTQQIENTYSIEPIRYVSNDAPRIETSRVPNQAPNAATAPAIPPRRTPCPEMLVKVLKNEITNLWNYYWYWGPISGGQAEAKLKDSPDGAFLVRDSTSDRYVFTMSFRNVGKILHTRIDFSKTGYSLFDQVEYGSIAELVEDAMEKSKLGVYCYTKTAKDDVQPNFPVRLLLPVSRYDKVPSLKYLSRFVIRQFLNVNDIEKLPLPTSLLEYLQEDGRYF